MSNSLRGEEYIVSLVGETTGRHIGRFADGVELLVDLWNREKDVEPRLIIDGGFGGAVSHSIWLHNWPSCTVVCITPDIRRGGYWGYDCVSQQTPEEMERFVYLVGKMEDWQSLGLTQYRDCDFIFIDTDHTYPAQFYQCITMWPLVRKGGMLMGHDYDNDAVKKGTDEFCALMKLPLPEVINCEDTTQFFVIRKGE